jgi:hypothetical protein
MEVGRSEPSADESDKGAIVGRRARGSIVTVHEKRQSTAFPLLNHNRGNDPSTRGFPIEIQSKYNPEYPSRSSLQATNSSKKSELYAYRIPASISIDRYPRTASIATVAPEFNGRALARDSPVPLGGELAISGPAGDIDSRVHRTKRKRHALLSSLRPRGEETERRDDDAARGRRC